MRYPFDMNGPALHCLLYWLLWSQRSGQVINNALAGRREFEPKSLLPYDPIGVPASQWLLSKRNTGGPGRASIGNQLRSCGHFEVRTAIRRISVANSGVSTMPSAKRSTSAQEVAELSAPPQRVLKPHVFT